MNALPTVFACPICHENIPIRLSLELNPSDAATPGAHLHANIDALKAHIAGHEDDRRADERQ